MSPMTVGLHRSLRLLKCVALAGALIGILGCGAFFGGLPDVELDTSIFDRSGFSRFSLQGIWLMTNSVGQTRQAVFDESGDLVSLKLPSRDVFEVTEDDSVEILLTSFGAFSITLRGQTEESTGVITLHRFEGLFSDDGARIEGDSPRIADDLSSSRSCDCRETWILQTE